MMLLLNCARFLAVFSLVTYLYTQCADDSIPNPCGINLAVNSNNNFVNTQTIQVYTLLSNGIQTNAQFRFSNPNKKGFALFFQALTHLTNLNLGFNTSLTEKCDHNTLYMQAVSEFLKKTTALTTLELYHNAIDDSGALFLAEGLKKNSSLKMLDLDFNSISNAGAHYLSDALKNNTTVETLSLAANPKITHDGLEIDPRLVFEAN
jgi:hypothetical protein